MDGSVTPSCTTCEFYDLGPMDHPCWGCYEETSKRLTNYQQRNTALPEDQQEFWDTLSKPELSRIEMLMQEVTDMLGEEIQREIDAKILEELRGRTVQKKSKSNRQ